MNGQLLQKLFNFKFASSRAFYSTLTLRFPSQNIHEQILAVNCPVKIAWLSPRNALQPIRHKHFNAAVMGKFGEKFEIKEVKQQKKLKDNEVRIKVHCCAVNVADSLICTGEYEQKPKLPFVPGYEFSGEIKEFGSSAKGFAEGDKVICLNKETFSGMAEECVAICDDVWKVPQDVSYENAAALADSYATVLIAARRVNLKEGDTILVTAGTGEMGIAAVDIAANLFKAKVIGACDTEDKTSLLRDKGAFSTINYSKAKIKDAIMGTTNGEGAKIIFDAVGGDAFSQCLESIAPEGSIVVMGFASRKIPEIKTNQLLPRSSALIGVSLTHYRTLLHDIYRHTVQEVIDMYLDEFIEPQIAAKYKLKEVNDAFKFIEEQRSAGKVIVNIT